MSCTTASPTCPAVARTSTFALNNATLPFTLALADKGYRQAMLDNPHLLAGLNIHKGELTYRAVSDALGVPLARCCEQRSGGMIRSH